MNISISPIMKNNVLFRATQKDEKVGVENKKEKSLPEDFSEKRTKIALGCCLATVVAFDILYFTMKRNMKYEKIFKKEKLAKQIEEACPIAPSNTFELFENEKDKFGLDAKAKFTRLVRGVRAYMKKQIIP